MTKKPTKDDVVFQVTAKIPNKEYTDPGGGTWVFFGWVCAARDSKLAPRSKQIPP